MSNQVTFRTAPNMQTVFNWGFWDGRSDKERGKVRELTEDTHDLTHVGKSFNRHYYFGYMFGIDELCRTLDSSEKAWDEFQNDETYN